MSKALIAIENYASTVVRLRSARKGIKMKNTIWKKVYYMSAYMLAGVLLLAGCGAEQEASGVNAEIQTDEVTAEVSEDRMEASSDEEGEQGDVESSKNVVTSELEPIPEPEPPQITLLMVGDILLHTPVEESALQEDGSYDFSAIFANTKEEIQAVDLALVNQEVIIGGEELGISGYPAFNAPYAIGDALVDAGFDVVCHGTNHALDKGRKGLVNCLNYWETNYPEIDVLGIHDTAEDQSEIYLYEQDGMKIAFLNYTYSTNGVAMPEDMPFAVDMLNKEKVIADIQRAEELADFTVVCPHWGTEYRLEADSSQAKWSQIFLENGVDLVLGTHPHVIEPIEWVTDEETEHEMLVYYSLGNYVNWTSSSGEGIANRMVGGMAQVTLGLNEAGETYIEEYGVEPVVAHLEEGTDGVTVYKLEDYTEELAARNCIVEQDSAFSLQYCQELCRKVWGNLYEETHISN